MRERVDVVIVTKMRDTLPIAMKAVRNNIPNPHFILVTKKGVIGDLRNEGLSQARSELVCFVDDDIQVPQNWFSQCSKKLRDTPSLLGVRGILKDGSTLGGLICNTKMLKEIGGFPHLDTFIAFKIRKLGLEIMNLDNVILKHLIAPLGMLEHFRAWFMHGFNTESKFGFNSGITTNFRMIFHSLRSKRWIYSLLYPLWLVKASYIKIFKVMGIT